MNSWANSHDDPANVPIILTIELNRKTSGSLLETYYGGWVRKEREILDFSGEGHTV